MTCRFSLRSALVVVSVTIGAIALTPSALAAQTSAAKPAPKPLKPASSPLTSVPKEVAAAFTQAYPNAKALHASKENEDGAVEYEIESVEGTTHRDIDYKPDGTLIEVEETIGATDVPDAVSKAITARYPKASITRREKVTTKAGAVSYEFGVKGAPVGEIVLNPDGSWVTPKMTSKPGKAHP